MSKQVICSSCGAKFRQSLPKCPYCDTLNYKGAEAEYMGRLQKHPLITGMLHFCHTHSEYKTTDL